jgi:type I restriction enzyme, S subunit
VEGLEVAVVAKSDWLIDNDHRRLDSEFQLKSYAEIIKHLKSIGSEQFGVGNPKIIHPKEIARTYVEEEGVWFLRAKNVRPLKIDDGDRVLIAPSDAVQLQSNLIGKGDVLLTRTGANRGQCAVYDLDDEAIASSHTFIIRSKKYDPSFLAVFFNCSHGKAQIDKGAYGAAQPEIAPYYLRNVWIPEFSESLLKRVVALANNANEVRALAKEAQQTAEAMLIDALGLGGWSPPEPLTYIRSAAAVRAAGRYDASYFAPRYDEAEARVVATGQARRIGDGLASLVKRGSQPLYADSGLPVINSRHVRTNRVLLSDDNRLAAPSRVQILKGDVLVNGTGFGTIGRAAPYMDADPAVPDNHVTVIRPIGVRPLYLSAFLNSQLGQLQIERMISGSSGQIELYPKDIESIYVWVADDAIQLEIEQQMRESFACEAKAQSLLTTAKRAVEIAIEDSEAAALAFLASSAHHD